MPYRLLLPATLDLVPADVDTALSQFGARPLSDRGCAWQLPDAGAPGVPADAAPVIVRLLPVKALAVHPDEPRFRIPKGTQRAIEVITPADRPRPADCRRVHDCATVLAHTLSLGLLNPYRGVYSRSAASYCDRLSDPPEADAVRVRRRTEQTHRRTTNRTDPGRINRAKRKAAADARSAALPPAAAPGLGLFDRMFQRLRGTKRHRLPLPTECGVAYVESLLRQIQSAVPIAKVTYDSRRHAILIDAADTPLVSRTIADLLDRYGHGNPSVLEVSLAAQ